MTKVYLIRHAFTPANNASYNGQEGLWQIAKDKDMPIEKEYGVKQALELGEFLDKLKGKIWNGTGGEMTTDSYRNILANVLKIYGLSFKYILTLLFVDKNFYCHTYEDSEKLESILEFRSDSLSSYYMRLKRQIKGRKVSKILAKPISAFLTRKHRGKITGIFKRPFSGRKKK